MTKKHIQKKKRIISTETQDYLVGGLFLFAFVALGVGFFAFLFAGRFNMVGLVLFLIVADFVGMIAYAGRKQKDE